MTYGNDIPTIQPVELDQTALDSIRALQQPGQPDLLTRIIDTYLDSAAELVEALQRSLREGDIEILTRSAHTLKSSSANLGAMGVSRICARLEAEVRAGNLDNAGAMVAEVCSEHDASSAALRRERDRSQTGSVQSG